MSTVLTLRNATKKFKSSVGVTEYQFTNEDKETTVVLVEKFKSGYCVEVRSITDFRTTNGLSTMKQVQNWLYKLTLKQ